MKTVAQLLNAKQNQQVYTIGPDEMVLDALRLMAEKNIGALLVVNRRGGRGGQSATMRARWSSRAVRPSVRRSARS